MKKRAIPLAATLPLLSILLLTATTHTTQAIEPPIPKVTKKIALATTPKIALVATPAEKTTPLVLIPTTNTLMNASVSAFPFALKEEVKTALAKADTLAYSTEETFSYAMPAVAEAPQQLASANYTVILPSASSGSSTSRVVHAKKTNFIQRFFSKVFHRKKPKPPISVTPSVSTVYTLPSPWKTGYEPAPTAQEQLLIGFIRKTNPKWDVLGAHVLAYWLLDTGERYEVDPRVLASLIAVESSFRPDAVSSSNAKGFGQLKDDTARWLGVDDSFDPYQNLQGTAKYLQILGQKFPDDASKAIGSYYVGQGTIERNGMTDAAWYYVGKVQRYLDELIQQSAGL
jgi:hypothetical protein